MKRVAAFLMIILLILSTSCIMPDNNEEKIVKDILAMDTYMTLTAYGDCGPKSVDIAVRKIEELDAMLSTGSDTSDISVLNSKGHAALSIETIDILKTAICINKDTGGAFNPLIYPLMKCWGFDTGNYRIPLQTELDECMRHMDTGMINIDEVAGEVKFADSKMQLDLGGIAKGYTSNRIIQIYKENGVTSGIVSLGGNVQTLGTKPDGSPWKVAIRRPDGSGEYEGVLSVNDTAVVTSGGYERYFEQNGNTYHHIIDPATGKPAQSGLSSVTIVNDDGMLADALSTAVYIMGYEKAVKFWREYEQPFEMILITNDGSQYVTEGLVSLYQSDTDCEVINRK